MKKLSKLNALVMLVGLILIAPGAASPQSTSGSAQEPISSADTSARKMQVNSGQKMKLKGLILRQEDNGFILREQGGSEVTVRVAGNTKIEEKKSNPFRSAKKFSSSQLVRSLNVEVEGHGDASGALIADKIKFSDDNLKVATMVDSQVIPIENRLGTTENRLSRTEQNAQRLAGQVDELQEVANLARGGAAAAQQSADAAIQGVNQTNDRITTLDDYEERKSGTVNFRVGSAVLSPEAKTMLDEIATQAKTERGFVIEVRGFASADGSENLNRALSQRRADAVVRYLAEMHEIPLRRIILPFGYGEAIPVADNSTRDGRQQNRRVEVKILVSRGLTTPVNVNNTRNVGSTGSSSN